MEKVAVQSAESYKQFFKYLGNWDSIKNISYHLQYMEFLYTIKKKVDAEKTTRSLLNKSLIIEMFSIVECIVDNLLTGLSVETGSGKQTKLNIHEFTGAKKLLDLAEYYGIIDNPLRIQMSKLCDYRNRIHIKRHDPKKHKYEYEAYSDRILATNEERFKNFLEFLWNKHKVDYSEFFWPQVAGD